MANCCLRPRLLLISLSLIAFANAVRGSFHFDDYSLFQSPVAFSDLFRLETTRPLTQLTFLLNRTLAGTEPLSWHLLNILLHVACVLLLFDCLRRILPGHAALLAAGLFAIHPIQTEAVAYVFARSTLLMTAFCLASWHAWLRQRPWTAVALFAAALASKEECVFFPLFLWVISAKRTGKPIAAMLALSLAAGLRVIAATRLVAGSGAGFTANIGPLDYFTAQGTILWRYLAQLLLPIGFTIDPDPHPIPAAGLFGWTAFATLLWIFRRKPETKWFLGALLLFLASSSVFPASDLAADRRVYLPLIALAAGTALLLNRLPNRLPQWLPLALTLVWLPLTIARTEIWRTEESLWRDAAEKAPGKVRPILQLSRAIQPSEALPLLDAAAKTHPNNPDLPAEIGRIELQSGHPAQALAAFGRTAALRPRDAQAINNVGVALSMLGQSTAAQVQFRRALQLEPCQPDARKNLGMAPCPPPHPATN